MNKKLLTTILLLFATALFVPYIAHSAEYYTYPISAHANYVEPSTFDTVKIDLDDVDIIVHGIDMYAASYICTHLERGDTILLNTRGGSVMAGNAIMRCIDEREDITIAVKDAYSMGTRVLLAGAKVCIYPDANIGFHKPVSTLWGYSVAMSNIQLTAFYAKQAPLIERLGYTRTQALYMERFDRLATSPLAIMPHGTMAGILGDRFVGECI